MAKLDYLLSKIRPFRGVAMEPVADQVKLAARAAGAIKRLKARTIKIELTGRPRRWLKPRRVFLRSFMAFLLHA